MSKNSEFLLRGSQSSPKLANTVTRISQLAEVQKSIHQANLSMGKIKAGDFYAWFLSMLEQT